jgi:hypothetical protein
MQIANLRGSLLLRRFIPQSALGRVLLKIHLHGRLQKVQLKFLA